MGVRHQRDRSPCGLGDKYRLPEVVRGRPGVAVDSEVEFGVSTLR